jgi:transcriptional regulator with XRE-family HTH domain
MLSKVRKQRGMSQNQLAKASGISVRTIQHYEQGERDINKASSETIYKLAQALSCDSSELLTIFNVDLMDELSESEKNDIIKREQAEKYSGFKAYPGTCSSTFNFIPNDMFERLSAKELGEVAKVINAAYQAGKREKAQD